LKKISAPSPVAVKELSKYHATGKIRKGIENKAEHSTMPFCKSKTVCSFCPVAEGGSKTRKGKRVARVNKDKE